MMKIKIMWFSWDLTPEKVIITMFAVLLWSVLRYLLKGSLPTLETALVVMIVCLFVAGFLNEPQRWW